MSDNEHDEGMELQPMVRPPALPVIPVHQEDLNRNDIDRAVLDENEDSIGTPDGSSTSLTPVLTCLGVVTLAVMGMCVAYLMVATYNIQEEYEGIAARVQQPLHRVIPRGEWGAQKSRAPLQRSSSLTGKILFLTSNSTPCEVESKCAHILCELQLQHIREWRSPDIAYNFIITKGGSIYEGRGWNYVTIQNYTQKAPFAIAFLGFLSLETPTSAQIDATKALLEMGIRYGSIEKCYHAIPYDQNKFLITLLATIIRDRQGCL